MPQDNYFPSRRLKPSPAALTCSGLFYWPFKIFPGANPKIFIAGNIDRREERWDYGSAQRNAHCWLGPDGGCSV
jgi:hypothetical protein